MTYSIIIFVLIVLIILIYTSLYHKIRSLEHKISELSQKIDQKNQVLQEIQDSPVTSTRNIPANPEKMKDNDEVNLTVENLHADEQRDWLASVFDFLKQNALTIIGIFTLVLGIGYFVKYAVDKNWIGESARVTTGFFIGALLMATGHFLRKSYGTFSSIIMGGGISILYFTVTIAFREYHFFSQNAAFGITCIITLASIALSYFYKSEILTVPHKDIMNRDFVLVPLIEIASDFIHPVLNIKLSEIDLSLIGKYIIRKLNYRLISIVRG